LKFIAHFDTNNLINEAKIIYKLNRMLPMAVAVHRLYRVHEEAHARFDALSRTYKYYVSTRKDPFKKTFSSLIIRPIDVELMNQACAVLKTHRDFQCFSRVKTDVKTYNCMIDHVKWEKFNDQLVFTI